jgi:serine phosphatase RsbU (regulator of sigma subunit)
MNTAPLRELFAAAAAELRSVLFDIRDLVVAASRSVQLRSTAPLVSWSKEGSMLDPVRFRRILVRILKILVLFEIISAFFEGLSTKDWTRFGIDLVIAGILYVMWDRIMSAVREQKTEFRKKVEIAPHAISLWDALVFSLLWSDEIYADIPADRRRIVVISYTLIALALIAAFVKIGTGLMVLAISGALVLGAVNLVSWVISLERTEKETLQTELRLAHDVQVALMPREHPTVPGLDIAGTSIPAKEVGGDNFDYFAPGGNRVGISVVDVSGKGMQAAMAAVFTSGAFASEVTKADAPAAILSSINKTVYARSRRGQFVAFLLAVIDPDTKSLVFANAGQTKPLLRSGTSVRWLDGAGVHFPLGMQPECSYDQQTVTLQSGDVLFLLTDGFTEAMNPAQEMFGSERIEQALARPGLEALGAPELVEYVASTVREYAAGAPQHDDMTMVVVKIR